jgi:type I restriction enzyme, S subunit
MSPTSKTSAAEEEAKPVLVPKLRFPEFRETEAWEQKEVGDLFQVTRGNVLSMTLVRDEKTEAMPYPVYSSQTKNNGLSGFYSEYLFEDAITWTTDGANAGDVNYRPSKFFCTNVCGVLLSSKGFANPCIAALINSVARKHVSYVGNPKLMNGVMGKIPIPLPPLPEQQKIAECLSSVGELMAAQARKVDALKTHKKGLMQQLFPREGETQPRLRFPEFQNAGEWESKTLGEVVELQSGFAFSSSNFGSEGRKLVTPKNFTKHGHGNFDESVSKYTTEDVPERFVCKPGDLLVLLTDLTPTCELLGKPLLLEEKDGTVLLNQRVVRVEPSASEVEALFLRYVFLSETYCQRIIKTATGSTVKHSSNKVLQEMPLFHPTLPEQHRIATCLSSLDALITAETQKHEALKTHKRGLMQQLFPSPEDSSQ